MILDPNLRVGLLEAMHDEIRRLLDPLFGSDTQSLHDSCWCPAADVYRSHHGWLIKFDLAGVRSDDIRIRATGHQLVVSGVRRDWTISEGQQAYSMEISYNRFERCIELPCELEHVEIQSDYRDGMLLISIMPRST